MEKKTSCMAIGTLREELTTTRLKINFVKELPILGIKMDRNLTNITDRNIYLKIDIIKNELEQWKRRNLTPIGRISIVKALIVAKLVHIFTALPNPSTKCVKELESMLFNFVWGKK